MKTKSVSRLDAKTYNKPFTCMMNFGSLLFMSVLLLTVSCAKSEDLETIVNETPNDNETPIDNNPPIDTTPTIDNTSLIVYTDIEPDFVSDEQNTVYDLDLNNDGIVDYTLNLFDDYPNDWLLINSPNNINGIISVTPWYANTVPLDNGREIYILDWFIYGQTYENWGVFTTGNCFAGEPSCSYDWKDKNDKFLGLRFLINGKTHYGWARIDVTSATQWIIKDYAYNATPNMPILAGQKE